MTPSRAAGLLAALVLTLAAAPRPALAAPMAQPQPEQALGRALAQLGDSLADRPASAQQLGSPWEAVRLEGATCGRGAPYTYYLNAAPDPEAGIVILLSGGGACLKEGPAPEGAVGVARSLHCMDFENFEDPIVNDQIFGGPFAAALVPLALPHFDRNASANPFRGYHFAAVPYCTGDVFAGRMTEPFDYDPSPDASFDVVHRGHLNLMAALEDLHKRFPGDVPVVLSGLSAGGFGAIFNFPEVIGRWPRTTLVPDSGLAPQIPNSLFDRMGDAVAARWNADALLPDWCKEDGCLGTFRLLAAHAAHFDGRSAPWRPFGYLQSQQDSVLTPYLETSPCGYEVGLRMGRAAWRPANLRGYVPATDKHVFSIVVDPANPTGGSRPYVSKRGVNVIDWFRDVATAAAPADLPADMVDPYLACHDIQLTLLGGAGGR